jgi:hypothetical protein
MCMENDADDEVQVPQGQISNLIMHNLPLRAMHYVLCIMHLISLRPTMVPMPKLCNKRIMHYYLMHYEKVDCTQFVGVASWTCASG